MGKILTIRNLEGYDITSIANIHYKVFRNFFTTKLGECFLINYYSSFLEFSHSISLVAEVSGRISGFIVGTYNSTEHKRCLLKLLGPRIPYIILHCIIFSPDVVALILFQIMKSIWHYMKISLFIGFFRWLFDLIGAFFFFSKKRDISSPLYTEIISAPASLTSVAVAPSAQLGTGLSLIEAFLDRACKLRVKSVLTSTDIWNRGAKRTFVNAGFTFHNRRREFNRYVDIYIYRCPDNI